MNHRLASDLGYLLLGFFSLSIALTCSGTGRIVAAKPRSVEAPNTRGAASLKPRPSATSERAAPKPGASESSQTASRLRQFRAALRSLSEEERSQPVRIAWFGDSHTAADFWPNVIRRSLQQRFGSGGPGFVRIGVEPYRHGQVKVTRSGKWERLPPSPAAISLQADGVFGVSGMYSVPKNGQAAASLEPYANEVRGPLTYTILYRLSPGASFRLKVGDHAARIDADSRASIVPESGIARLEVPAEKAAALSVSEARGRVELFGVIVESTEPGVVLDTLGIDGARLATPLAWDGGSFVAELKTRAPELLVFAYGTNEVFDARAPARYAGELTELVGRAKQAVPAAACLVIGPTDVLDTTGTAHPRVLEITLVQRKAAEEAGCAYVSAQELMGGPGSYSRWQEHEPRWARSDRVHLTIDGYRELGQRLAARLFTEL